jgi:hypothetical protein
MEGGVMRGGTAKSVNCRSWIAWVAFFVVCLGASGGDLRAFPAFARKYRTSCQTCHIAFPALTPFGEAFRLNGYRFPAGTDANVSKDEPVPLGSEGYKKMWPKSVWPGELAGAVPISFIVGSEIVNDRTDRITSFDGLGGALELQAAGTFGEHISYFGNLAIERSQGETSTDLERFFVIFRPWTSPAFQFKVGAFDPGLLLLSSHRSLIDADVGILSQTVGDNGWTAEPAQEGIEFYGVASHRLLYNVGLVEGTGNASNNSKDYYGRLAYKFGGMRLDGTTAKGAEAGLPANPKPWSEKSLTVSAFIYEGIPLLSQTTAIFQTDPACTVLPCPIVEIDTTLSQEDKFGMYGGDLAWNFLDVIIRAGASTRTDKRPYLADPTDTDVKSKNRFGEVDWVAFPWLVPALRWESFELAGDTTDRATLAVNFLIRANVKGFLAADQVKESGSDYHTEEIAGGVAVGF